MRKLTIGVLAGAALASAAAVSPLAASGSTTTSTGATVNAAVTATGAPQATSSTAVRVAAAAVTTTTKKVTPTQTKEVPAPRVLKVTRVVTLNLPVQGIVGSNITGFIQVTDTNGVVTSPVAGVHVALQKKAATGTGYTTVADDVTDLNGTVNVAFTVKANTTWRAAILPDKGTPQYSKSVLTAATAQLSWATRPDLSVEHGVATPYGFRINPVTVGQAHLEYALASAPTKWTPLKAVTIPATGVVIQSLTFPKAGAYLVRGATAASSTTSAGYTTVLNVEVS